MSGLLEVGGAALAIDHLRVEGTVVNARGVSAFAGVGHVADGTSNTVIFSEATAHLPATERLSWHFEDVLVSGLALPASDRRLATTVSGAPFAAAVLPASWPDTGRFGGEGTVVQTPLGPVGIVRGGGAGPSGIIAILIGL